MKKKPPGFVFFLTMIPKIMLNPSGTNEVGTKNILQKIQNCHPTFVEKQNIYEMWHTAYVTELNFPKISFPYGNKANGLEQNPL